MGSDLIHMQNQREHAEWGPLSRAVDLIRTELNLHPDISPGMVAIKALDAINALRTLHDIEHPDCDDVRGEDCPARLALLGTTIVNIGAVLVDTAHLSDEEFTRDYPLMDPLPPAVVARAKQLLGMTPPDPVFGELAVRDKEGHPLLIVDTTGPLTFHLPTVPYRPVLDAEGDVQYDNGKMIQSPDAPAAPVHVAAGKNSVLITGRRGGQPITLLPGHSALFEWESRPPGWCLRVRWTQDRRAPDHQHVGGVEKTDCDCSTLQLGWATAECSTCGGHVSYEVYCAGYPGRRGDPRDPDQVKDAIAKARAGGET